ncbi:MAG: guanine-specific ribonuclease [Variovorax sp.]|nr:guanine-specific ribonuclease [Variovorax sp.]
MATTAPITSLLSKLVLAALLLVLGIGSMDASARGWRGGDDNSASAVVALAELPPQGRATYQAILRGGPFRHGKDGVVFGNRERLLPAARRGHYREYTVETPGAQDRGARRIVCGGAPQEPPEACWYTADHYASFRRIAP